MKMPKIADSIIFGIEVVDNKVTEKMPLFLET